jgi:hypothetical protein
MSELLHDSLDDVRVFFRNREATRPAANASPRGKVQRTRSTR